MAKIKVNDKNIYYETHGEGKPIIILNGIMMSTLSWHLFLPNLKDYQVVFMDFFDQGQSDRLESFYTHQIQVQAVEALVEHLNLREITLVGISYGAEIALQYALNNQDMMKSLVIFNGASYTSPWLKDIGIGWQLAARTKNAELFYHITIPYIYSSKYYSDHAKYFEQRKSILLEVFTPMFLEAMDRLIESSENYNIQKELKELRVRTIIVTGDCDYITPANEGKLLHQLIEDSEYIELKGSGHASMYEKQADFIQIIKNTFII